MDKTRVINFGKIDYYGRGKKINSVDLEVSLEKADTDKPVFTVCGNVWNGRHTDIVAGGQCIDDIEPYFKDNRLFGRIADLWKKYHLNDMHAGTAEQEKYLKEVSVDDREKVVNEIKTREFNKAKAEFGYVDFEFKRWCDRHDTYWTGYYLDCELLKRADLYEVEVDGKPYRYGSGWIYAAIPETALSEINKILDGSEDSL